MFKPNECVTGHEEQDAGVSDSMNPPPSSASASPNSATYPLVSASSSSSRPPRMDENAPSSSAGLTGTNTTQLPHTSQQEDCMSQNDIPKTSVFDPFGEPSVSHNLIEGSPILHQQEIHIGQETSKVDQSSIGVLPETRTRILLARWPLKRTKGPRAQSHPSAEANHLRLP